MSIEAYLVGFMRKSICSALNGSITRNSHTVTFYHVKTPTDLMSTTRILKNDIKIKTSLVLPVSSVSSLT